jgi:hypothetical protein
LSGHAPAPQRLHRRCACSVPRSERVRGVWLLPAGVFAGWDLHPLESAALSRRTPIADINSRWRGRGLGHVALPFPYLDSGCLGQSGCAGPPPTAITLRRLGPWPRRLPPAIRRRTLTCGSASRAWGHGWRRPHTWSRPSTSPRSVRSSVGPAVLVGHDVPTRLRLPGGAFNLQVEQVCRRRRWVAQTRFRTQNIINCKYIDPSFHARRSRRTGRRGLGG